VAAVPAASAVILQLCASGLKIITFIEIWYVPLLTVRCHTGQHCTIEHKEPAIIQPNIIYKV